LGRYEVERQFKFIFMRDDAVFYSGTVMSGDLITSPTPNPTDKE
jgi:hypothetical protein